MALEIIVDPYGVRSFESILVVADNDHSTFFGDLTEGYEYTESTLDWVKSFGNAIDTVIQDNVSVSPWLNFSQYGYQGGRLTRLYSDILTFARVVFGLPTHLSDHVGIRLRTITETAGNDDAIYITINRNIIKVFEYYGLGYTSLDVLDTSIYAAGVEVQIDYDPVQGTIVVRVDNVSTSLNLVVPHNIRTIEFFTEDTNNYYLEMQIFRVEAIGGQQKNLNLTMPPQLVAEYVVGDILIVSAHEGSDYGGSSVLPRVLGEFEPLTATKDVALNNDGFQRFWAKTLTANEPSLYQFTRGDSESYYDDPTCVGFIVRGSLFEDLSVTWTNAVTGNSSIISSNSCGAILGDLVYGYAHNQDTGNQMYGVIPTEDFLWYKTYPHGVTSIREATVNDDGIVRFALSGNFGFDYNVFAARISNSTLEPSAEPRLREYETQLPEEAPTRLQDFYSQRLLEVLGVVKDDAVADSLDAIAETFASTASEKRLLEIGADRLIDRYPTESLLSYREAVVNASSILEWRGTAKGIQDEIARFGYTATYIQLRQAAPTHWAEFILILRNGRIQRSLGSGGPWGIGMSLLERDALLKLVRRWKNSDERLAMMSYALNNNDFWGESGTWGDTTTWNSGGTKVIYARPYAWGDNPNDTWNSSQGTWGNTDTYPVQEE